MRSLAGLVVIVAATSTLACDGATVDVREVEIANVVARADEPLVRTRPALVAGKYARMAASPGDFYRGSLAVFRHDLRDGTTDAARSRFALDAPLVPSVGDPHIENFGTLRAADGSLALEPNDLDAADRAPYLWDVRRLCAGVALAAALSNEDDLDARAKVAAAKRAIARRAADSYARAISAAASGAPPGRVDGARGNAILDDAFSRSDRDRALRRELTDFTIVEGGIRKLLRGVADPTDTQNVFADLPPPARAALPATLERWRASLLAPLPADQIEIIDAVRELGSGVASWPRVRAIVLLRGPTDAPDDDLLIEVKELADSGIAGLEPPGVYARDLGARLVDATRTSWARPDAAPLWGASEWLGLAVQIREETQGQKTLRISRLVGARGTEDALGGASEVLGEIVARVHASRGDARAIADRIGGGGPGFADEQADFASGYADRVIADAAHFRSALVRLGPRLGVPFDSLDAPRPDFAALLGTPPPPEPVLP